MNIRISFRSLALRLSNVNIFINILSPASSGSVTTILSTISFLVVYGSYRVFKKAPSVRIVDK